MKTEAERLITMRRICQEAAVVKAAVTRLCDELQKELETYPGVLPDTEGQTDRRKTPR